MHNQVWQRPLNLAGRHHPQARPIPQEVVEAVGAQGGRGLFEERVEILVEEVAPIVAIFGQNGRNIGPLQIAFLHLIMVALAVVAMIDVIDNMAEGGVADIMEQSRQLFLEGRALPPDQEHGANGMLQPGDRRCQADQAADAVLQYAV